MARRDMSRVETFTDAAFAFALTLLVVSLDPPTTYEGLLLALRGVPSFLAAAALLMMFWWGHHQWSRNYDLDDGATVFLSCVLVFTVLVYVYPLRYMTGVFFTWVGRMTGLPLGPPGDTGIESAAQVYGLFAVYGLGFAAMSLTVLLLYVHAWRNRTRLGLDAVGRHDIVSNLWAWGILAATGLASAVSALVLDDPRLASVPGWIQMTLPVVMPTLGWVQTRKHHALVAEAAGDPGVSEPPAAG